MNSRPLLLFMLWTTLAFAGLSVIFHFAGSAYSRAVLPLVGTAVEWTHPDWIDPSVHLSERKGREAIVFRAKIPAGTYFQDGEKMLRVKRADVAVDPAIMQVQPIIVLALLIGWPFLDTGRKLRALLIAVPCVLIAVAADTALRLADFAAQGVDSGWWGDLRSYFNYFMGNGGRQFSAVLVFLISIAPFHLAPVAWRTEKEESPKTKSASAKPLKKKRKKKPKQR